MDYKGVIQDSGNDLPDAGYKVSECPYIKLYKELAVVQQL